MLAAASISALRIAAALPGMASDLFAVALLGFASLVIGALFLRTAIGVLRGEPRTLIS